MSVQQLAAIDCPSSPKVKYGDIAGFPNRDLGHPPMLAGTVRELSTMSLVCGEPETVRAFFTEKDSVGVLFECSRLVTARKMLETVGHRASLTGRCHWHMVKRERCVALSAASYSVFHCRTLSFDARRGRDAERLLRLKFTSRI